MQISHMHFEHAAKSECACFHVFLFKIVGRHLRLGESGSLM